MAIRQFWRSDAGGVAVWFGVCFPVIAMGSLVAVDFARASTADQILQECIDAAALIAARSSATTSDGVDAAGDAALAAMLSSNTALTQINGLSVSGGRIAGVTFALSGSTVTATARATVTPIVASAFTGGPMPINATSTVVRGNNRVEIALVLDTTGSMQGSKIANLKTAAKSFITQMETAAATASISNPVRISVVPFSTTVRVQDPLSMASYNTGTYSMTGLPTWVDGRARSIKDNDNIFEDKSSGKGSATRTDRFALLKTMGRSWGGCVEAREDPYDIRETAPTSSDVDTLFVPWFWPDEPDTDDDYLNDYLNDDESSNNWAKRLRNQDKYDTSSFKVSGTFIPSSAYGAAWDYGPNAACNMQKIMRLSNSFGSLRTHIDGLVPSGETNVPLGLMWGWHTLSPNAPFSDGLAYGTPNTTKIIILMTDGDNTMNATGSGNKNGSWYHGYGYIWQNRLGTNSSNTATRTAKMNERMVANGNQEDLCGNIKARGIVLYTVGVGVSDDAVQLLTDCATDSSYYYDVDSSGGGLSSVFTSIANSIQSLRIAH